MLLARSRREKKNRRDVRFSLEKQRNVALALSVSILLSVMGVLMLVVFFSSGNNVPEKKSTVDKVMKEYTTAQTDTINILPLTGENADINRGIVVSKPAVVYIFNHACANVTVRSSESLRSTSGKSFNVCTSGFGSGFYVDKEGYIATNAHVASANPIDTVIYSLLYGYDPEGLFESLLIDAPSYYQGMGVQFEILEEEYDFESDYEDVIIEMVISAQREGILDIDITSNDNFVLKDKVFKFDETTLELLNESDYIRTELIDYESINSYHEMYYDSLMGELVGIEEPDVAILKVVQDEDYDYPSISLANPNTLTTGQSVSVIGFPGVASSAVLFSERSSKIATVTRGTISAIKENATGAFRLVQMDASISYGNSGGPVVNDDGEIVAIATYGISFEQSGDFNAGVSVEELQKIMTKNDIENDTGDVTQGIEQGLDYFESEYYNWAIESFESVKDESPNLDDHLDPLIAIAQDKVDKGEDNSPVFTVFGYYVHRGDLVLLIGSICLIAIGLILAFLMIIIGFIKKKKKGSNAVPQVPVPQSVTPYQGSLGGQGVMANQ